jgi:hypothetical protein
MGILIGSSFNDRPEESARAQPVDFSLDRSE